MNISKGKIGSIILSVILIIVVVWGNPYAYNEAGNRQVIQHVNGDLEVKFDPGLYFCGFFSKVTTWPNNVTIQCGPEEKRSPEADYWESYHAGTFAGGDQASIGHTTKWDMPNTAPEQLELHTTYNNIDNLMTTTLLQYQKETATYSCQRMESEAHYSGGQSQLKEYFQDQLRNGQVLLETKTKTRKQTDGTADNYIEVKPRLNRDSTMMRTISDIQKYNLYASFTSIDYVDYDDRIDKKLADKIDAAAEESTSKQRLITAQQEKEEALVEGEKLIAQTQAREEADEQKEVIQARKAKLVAKEQADQAKFTADRIEEEGRAKAAANLALVKAGLTPQQQAEWDYKTAVGVAAELAKRDVPQIIMSGGSEGGSSLSNAYTMEQMLLMQKQLSKK